MCFIRLKEVQALTRLSRSEIYRRSSLGSFPQRVRLGEKSVAWVKAEVEAWMAERVAERDGKGDEA